MPCEHKSVSLGSCNTCGKVVAQPLNHEIGQPGSHVAQPVPAKASAPVKSESPKPKA